MNAAILLHCLPHRLLLCHYCVVRSQNTPGASLGGPGCPRRVQPIRSQGVSLCVLAPLSLPPVLRPGPEPSEMAFEVHSFVHYPHQYPGGNPLLPFPSLPSLLSSSSFSCARASVPFWRFFFGLLCQQPLITNAVQTMPLARRSPPSIAGLAYSSPRFVPDAVPSWLPFPTAAGSVYEPGASARRP